MIFSKYLLKANSIKVAFILICLFFLIINESNFLTILVLVVPFFLLNFARPLILKNYFIIYTSLLFFVGGGFFFPDLDYIRIHGILILLFFSLGYYVPNFLFRNVNRAVKFIKEDEFYIKKMRILKKSMVLFFALRLIFIFIKIFQTGFYDYFSGASLATNIGEYGKEDFNKGINDVIDNFLGSIHTILTIIYIVYIFKLERKINYYYLALPFIFIPLISLSRNTFAFGLVLVLIIYSLGNMNYGKISKKVFLVTFCSIFFSFFVAMILGGIRESKISDGENADIFISVYGELSPIIAYNNLNEKIDDLGYQFGYTIFPPLIFKIIPRSWYPNKPINSTAYYSLKYEKDSFDNGFMIPSTIYGDLFLNYGFYCSLVIFSLFGLLIYKLDQIYLFANFDYLYFFIIIYLNFYGLLRNNLPEGLFPIVQGFLLYYFLNTFINSLTNYKLKNG